jgi:hypothetical protein
MNREMPTMAASAHSHSTYAGGALLGLAQSGNHAALGTGYLAVANQATPPFQFQQANLVKQESKMAARRLVQVFVADPNGNVPLASSVLYRGEQKLTDSTDQELFFELDIREMLETHNAARIKIVDKKVKERTEYLEPAKIRDLKMVVVTIASF